MTDHPGYDLVLVEAMRFDGTNGSDIRDWMAGYRLPGPPAVGEWVMRTTGGYRVVPAALFAATYRTTRLRGSDAGQHAD